VFAPLQPFVPSLLEGKSLTVFAYGQTSSGKTHTMFGQDWESSAQNGTGGRKLQQSTAKLNSFGSEDDSIGIIPRAVNALFESISAEKSKGIERRVEVYASFLQVYCEKIYDLLTDDLHPVSLSVRQSKIEGIFVEGLTEYSVKTAGDCMALIRRGEKNRKVRKTSMNTKSSRSHTIFQLAIEAEDKAKGVIKRSKLNLCDLAGSEKIEKQEIKGTHLKELTNINLSLTTLGKVIHALSHCSKIPPPFRDSKLTRLLQTSLGGSGTKCFLIANLSPADKNFEESVATLKFAERAKNVKTRVGTNEISATDSELVKSLVREVRYLKEILNIKKTGGNMSELHHRLKKLEEENLKLKKTQYTVDDVMSLREENNHLKLELERFAQCQEGT
jgi:Kinesin motor domain